MGRVVPVEVMAKKGAAHRALRQAVDRVREAIRAAEEPLPPAMIRALDAAHVAANKLIGAAGRSDHLEIQLLISESPLEGWEASVRVSVPQPTYREA